MSDATSRGTLHGVIFVPFVRKVRAVLALKKIPYTHVSVMPGATDASFRALSPLSKVPVWEEPGFVLPDSSAIVAYLDRISPSPPLYPVEPRAYASTLFWEEYADTRLVEAIEPVFYERIVRPRVLRQAGDEAIVRRNLDEVIPAVFDQLETLYLAAGPLRPGASHDGLEVTGRTPAPDAPARAEDSPVPDVAALAVWSPIVNLEHVGESVDPTRWPRLARFLARTSAQPALAPIVAGERAALRPR